MFRTISNVGKRGLFRNIMSTSYLQQVVTINVPALGESITEGSIAVWEKDPGATVNIDDVVVTIETDKVTVDIKSAYGGKLVEQLVAAAESVNVGSPLYKIDTEGYVTPPASENAASKPVAPPPKEHIAPSSGSSPSARTHPSGKPSLIHFTGKRSLADQSAHAFPAAVPPTPTAAAAANAPSSSGTKAWTSADMEGYNAAWLGRPALSAAEIEAVESGGASIVWGK